MPGSLTESDARAEPSRYPGPLTDENGRPASDHDPDDQARGHPPRGGRLRRRGRRPDEPAASSTPVLLGHRTRLLGIGVAQLIVLELVVVAVLLAVRRGVVTAVAAVVLGAAVLLLTFGRRRGRWAYEWLRLRMSFRRRQRRGGVGVLPGLRTTEVRGRDGRDVGLIGDGSGWCVLLEVESALGPVGQDTGWLPLPLLAAALEAPEARLAAAQVLVHTMPAPAPNVPAEHPLGLSYARLLGQPVPAMRTVWVVLRLDPARCPEAVARRGGGDIGAARTLLAVVSRLADRLGSSGVVVRVLRRDEAADALLVSAGLTGDAHQDVRAPAWLAEASTEGAVDEATESWHSWRSGGVEHVTWWVRRWPSAGSAGGAGGTGAGGAGGAWGVGDLGAVPADLVSVSLTLDGVGPAGVSFTGHVRVACGAERSLPGVTRALEAEAATRGIGLLRLDGAHAPGVRATLPLAAVPSAMPGARG